MLTKKVMRALYKCLKWKEQVKVSKHRKVWTVILNIEALGTFLKSLKSEKINKSFLQQMKG
jgi:hypothetical protein